MVEVLLSRLQAVKCSRFEVRRGAREDKVSAKTRRTVKRRAGSDMPCGKRMRQSFEVTDRKQADGPSGHPGPPTAWPWNCL